MDDAFNADGMEMLSGIIEDAAAKEAPKEPEPEPEEVPAPPEPEPEPEPVFVSAPVSVPESEEIPEPAVREVTDREDNVDYASAEAGEAPPDAEEQGKQTGQKPDGKPLGERLLSPIIGLMGLIAVRQEQRAKGGAARPTLERGYTGPDPDARETAKLYGSQLSSLRLRAIAASVLSALMLYISWAWSSFLPLTGALGGSIRVASMLLMLMEVSVLICGLDLFTGGLLAIRERRLGIESLVAVSCVLAVLDALILGAVNKEEYGLPFCAVGGISMTSLLWGAYLNCRSGRISFRLLATGKSPYAITCEKGSAPGALTLLKSRRSAEGFIARSEEEDLSESAYGMLTPFLLLASLLLGLLCSLARGHAGAVLHCISGMVSVSAAFSCGISVALPLLLLEKKLAPSGASVAGWSGMRDIGAGRDVIVTDSDVFPRGTARIGNIRLVEGADADKVIAYTGSVIAASGSTLAAPFAELLRRNGYAVCRVESFEPKDGGGMTAAVRGESVSVGSAGFMNLIGIRMPRKLTASSAIYTAINGALVAIFEMQYEPTSQVQEALVLLNQSHLNPVFAVRDFNITPTLIKELFDIPADNFCFPAYSERYDMSVPDSGENSRVAAILGQEGMGPLVDVAECSRKAWQCASISTAVSAAAGVLGLLLIFILFWMGRFHAASVGNAITFLIVCLIPEIILSVRLWRM